MRYAGLFTALLVVTAVSTLAARPFHAAASTEDATWIVVYDPGPRWQAGVAPAEQPGIGPHGRYLMDLYAAGVMQMAGPLERGGGLVVFRAADRPAAQAIVEADPGVAAGLLTVNLLQRWEPRDWDRLVQR